jgi:DNA-binding NtrC family response regulator
MAFVAGMTDKAVNRQRVLVVEDDAKTRERVGEALAQAGFGPTLAGTGEQGLLLLREWPRRMDWLYSKTELPGLVDGWILADEFHQAHPGRPVLYGVPPHAKRPSHGGDIILETPVSPRRVVDVLLRLGQSEEVPASEVTRWAA